MKLYILEKQQNEIKVCVDGFVGFARFDETGMPNMADILDIQNKTKGKKLQVDLHKGWFGGNVKLTIHEAEYNLPKDIVFRLNRASLLGNSSVFPNACYWEFTSDMYEEVKEFLKRQGLT